MNQLYYNLFFLTMMVAKHLSDVSAIILMKISFRSFHIIIVNFIMKFTLCYESTSNDDGFYHNKFQQPYNIPINHLLNVICYLLEYYIYFYQFDLFYDYYCNLIDFYNLVVLVRYLMVEYL